MPLNDLSLQQLTEIADGLAALRRAGDLLVSHGIEPRFDLTPGVPACIMTDVVLACVGPSAWPTAMAGPGNISEDQPASVVDLPASVKPKSSEALPTPPPTASEESAGGGAPPVDLPGPPGGAPISAARGHMNLKAAPWTQAEDETLIAAVVESMTRHGMARHTATAAAVRSLPGRTGDAAVYRGKTKLRDRIDAALSAAALRQAQTETPEIPEGPALAIATDGQTASDGDAAVGGNSPAAAQPVEVPGADEVAANFERPMPLDPDDLHGDDLALWRFLRRHRPKWPMTPGTDLDLIVGLGRGDKLPTLSADLGIDTEALKLRYRTLTSSILDARGNVSIEGGPRLIKLLRRIAKIPAEAA